MTREEAIKICKQVRKYFKGGKLSTDDTDAIYGALTEAIKALQEQKTGKWIYRDPHSCSITCSVCGGYALSSGKLDPFWLTTEWNQVESAFCPNCGCRMIEQQESEDEE